MPKHKSYGPKVKERAKILLEALLGWVDGEFEEWEYLKIETRWKEDSYDLVVKTQLRYLEALTEQKLNKDKIKETLKRFEDFLGILEDNRAKTQGSADWHFTLKLWSRDKSKNLQELEKEWEKLRPEKSKQATGDLAIPPSEESWQLEKENEPSLPLHNLPITDHSTFVGQQTQLTKLLKLLSFEHPAHVIAIEGVGGIGKTSLVLAAAYRCLAASEDRQDFPGVPNFAAIIFTSAKQEQIVGIQISPRQKQERTLQDIFRAILRTLDNLDTFPANFEEQWHWVRENLSNQSTLLIIDNLETCQEQQEVLAFIGELPPTVKVVLTSRVRLGLGACLHLDCLPPKEGKYLLQQRGQEKTLQLKEEHLQKLYEKTGGHPLAIVYTIGQVAVYGIFSTLANQGLNQATSDVAQFCFEDSTKGLRSQPTHRLLMSLGLFSQSASLAAMTEIALSGVDALEEIAQLHQLCLIKQVGERYQWHQLTREYALKELQGHPEFEQLLRERWINWYLCFSRPYATTNWRRWQEYKLLEQEWDNLRGVVTWCLECDRYEDVQKFWQCLKGYTYILGYWQERLVWTNWLLQKAQQRQDRLQIAEALSDQGCTLTSMGQPQQLAEAETLFIQAEKFSDRLNVDFQLELAINRAILAIAQNQLSAALNWLNESQTWLQQKPSEDPNRQHQLLRLNYYQAHVCYKKGEFSKAQTLYRQALPQAQAIGWQQMEVYSLNWLADLAIEAYDWENAADLLEQSWPLAKIQKDRRSIAFHQRSWAMLEQGRGEIELAQKWAEKALRSFKRLGMGQKAEEMVFLRDEGIMR